MEKVNEHTRSHVHLWRFSAEEKLRDKGKMVLGKDAEEKWYLSQVLNGFP